MPLYECGKALRKKHGGCCMENGEGWVWGPLRQEGLSEKSHEVMGHAGRGNIPCRGRP